jgi:hypothetical protein
MITKKTQFPVRVTYRAEGFSSIRHAATFSLPASQQRRQWRRKGCSRPRLSPHPAVRGWAKYFWRNLGPRLASFCSNKSIFITKKLVYASKRWLLKISLQCFLRQILHLPKSYSNK